MMLWLDHCEWNAPGSNRSTITIETAVAQQVRAEDQAELIAKFNAKAYDDRVQIRHNAIVSETSYSYSATVRNMNFGATGVCRDMKRATWTPADWQGAMMFIVNGRYYGYAAVCGNLFELDGRLPPIPERHIPPEGDGPAPVPERHIPPSEPTPPSVPTEPPGAVYPPTIELEPPYGSIWPPVVPFWPPYYGPLPIPLTPIPEPSTWALMALGLTLCRTLGKR